MWGSYKKATNFPQQGAEASPEPLDFLWMSQYCEEYSASEPGKGCKIGHENG